MEIIYKTIQEEKTAEIVEKKSKFIANIFYIESSRDAEEKIEKIQKKFHDARHHCFAYRIIEEDNIIERASDDGEPSGTAGAPMLKLLSKNKLVNVLVVVTRYFGGILLGTGGLVRAYTQVTSQVINKSNLVIQQLGEVLKISISYQNLAYFKYYCNKNNIKIIKINFDDEPFTIIEATLDEKDKIIHEIQKKEFNLPKIEIMQKGYILKDITRKY